MLSSVISSFGSLRRLAGSVAVLGALALPGVSAAQSVTTFEDPSLAYGPGCQWGGGSAFHNLDGMKWDGFRPLDLKNLSSVCGRSTNTGYAQLQSANVGNMIAIGAGSAWLSSFNPFQLTSMVAGAGWQDGMTLTLTSYLGAVLMDTRTITLNAYQTGASPFTNFYTGPTDYIGFTPDYAPGVDVFNSLAESCAGVAQPCPPYKYESWFVDNLTFVPRTVDVTVTPEPATFAMMGVGIAALAIAGRRRKRV